MNEHSAEYSNQGGHYEADGDSDLRVLSEPLSFAEDFRKMLASGCQWGSLDELQALRQTCADSLFQAVTFNRNMIINFIRR